MTDPKCIFCDQEAVVSEWTTFLGTHGCFALCDKHLTDWNKGRRMV